MSKSGNIINYNLRAAKSVERRMILFTAKELLRNTNISNYRYIGMGSTYFTDFKLFHKELHIEKMISIEMEASLIPRCVFNKPFNCIEILPFKSTEALPKISWNSDAKDLIWMDYDGIFTFDIFDDIEYIFNNINQGSIYIMTCNKQLTNYKSLEEFKEQFGELVPNDIDVKDLSAEKDFLLIQRMLTNKILETLNNRNHKLKEPEKLTFNQLFLFTYKDSSNMISFGGFIDFKSNNFKLSDYNLDKFEFIKTQNERFKIEPPTLSYKEIHFLNTHLPNTEKDFINIKDLNFIPEGDLIKYRTLYKYLPTYMDVVQ
jgi:hypothetical protein